MLFLLLTIFLSHACDQQTLEAIAKPEPKPPVAINNSLTSPMYMRHKRGMLANLSKEDAKSAAVLLEAQLKDAAKLARAGQWTKAHGRLENTLPFDKSGYKIAPIEERERIILEGELDVSKLPSMQTIHKTAGRKSSVSSTGEIRIAELLVPQPDNSLASIWIAATDRAPQIVAIRATMVRLQMEEQIHVLQMLKEHAGLGAYLQINRFSRADLNEILTLNNTTEKKNLDIEADAHATLIKLLGSENVPEYYSNSYPAARRIVNRVLGR